jgi:sugar-specific transcriptional regulator TrmB
MKHLSSLLLKLGFDQAEIDLYVLLVRLGVSSLDTLTEQSKKRKLTVVAAIDALMRRGLVGASDDQSRQVFFAEHPRKLQAYMENTIVALQTESKGLEREIIELAGEMDFHQPKMRFYEGKEGLKNILEERLHLDAKQVFCFSPMQKVQRQFFPEESKQYQDTRKKRGIKYETIFSIPDGHPKKSSNPESERLYVAEKDYPFESDIAMYENLVSMVVLEPKSAGFVLESKEIATTLRSIFKLAKVGVHCQCKKEKRQ